MITPDVQLAFDILVLLFVIVAARKIWELDTFKKGLIAHTKALPTPPSKQQIAGWLKIYNDLPEFLEHGALNPRRLAYKARLIEVGALADGD